MSTYKQGWYPVPDSELERFHDGDNWTENYRDENGLPVAPPVAGQPTQILPPPPTNLPSPPVAQQQWAASPHIQHNMWTESLRQQGVEPPALYQQLVAEGKTSAQARAAAERLVPERARKPLVTALFYFAFGFAALALAGALHAVVDLSFADNSKDFVADTLTYGEIRSSGSDGARNLLAFWLTMFVIATPIAAVAGRLMFKHDREEKYAILSSDRYSLNGTLIVIASVIAVLRLLVYLYGLFIAVLSGETSGDPTIDFLHTLVTVAVAGAVLLFGKIQYNKYWKTLKGE